MLLNGILLALISYFWVIIGFHVTLGQIENSYCRTIHWFQVGRNQSLNVLNKF